MPGRHARRPVQARRLVAQRMAGGAGIAAVLASIGTFLLVPGRMAPDGPPPAAVATGVPRPTPVPAELAACARSLASGAGVLSAASIARDHWAVHVRAQIDLDRGRIDVARAARLWAETKAFGDTDLAAYDTARRSWRSGAGDCRDLGTAGSQPGWRAATTGCADRAAAQDAALRDGAAVVEGWRSHVSMMKAKAHTDPAVYGRMWHQMVRAAPADLDRFASAERVLAQLMPCAVPV